MTPVDNKRLAFETVFEQGAVRVVFDVEDPDIVVPKLVKKQYKQTRYVAFDYSMAFVGVKTTISDIGIKANLSFGGKSHNTVIPWTAVRAIIQGGIILDQWYSESELGGVAQVDDQYSISIHMEPGMEKWVSQLVAEA